MKFTSIEAEGDAEFSPLRSEKDLTVGNGDSGGRRRGGGEFDFFKWLS